MGDAFCDGVSGSVAVFAGGLARDVAQCSHLLRGGEIADQGMRRQSKIASYSSYWLDGMTETKAIGPARPEQAEQGGNGEVLVRAFNEARTDLVSSLFFLLGNYEDALDATQETFIKCWRTRAELPEVRNMKAWIFRIGLNAAKDLQRSAWRRRSRPLPDATALVEKRGLSPEQAFEEREAKERLRAALVDLRPEEKEIFLLRQNASLTYEEIARIKRSPVGTVKTQMRAALAKLRQALAEGQA
jgi:RNA polymerase sigma-70 factor, ECF subfamily